METAVLLLGTNLGNRAENLETALSRIRLSLGSMRHQSSIYESEPWGMESRKWFYNQCISLLTSLEPGDLLKKIKAIELGMGRAIEREGYRDRIIDIDILYYGEKIIHTGELVIPHPRIAQRRFVMIPLLEICPAFKDPQTGRKLMDMLDSTDDRLIVRKLT